MSRAWSEQRPVASPSLQQPISQTIAERETSKQTGTTASTTIKFVLESHTCERRRAGGGATCLSSSRSAPCLSLVPPALFVFLCGAEMLKLHFSDVVSLEVCGSSAGVCGKEAEEEEERRRGRGTGREIKKAERKGRERERERLSHSFCELNLCRAPHLPYMLFSYVNSALTNLDRATIWHMCLIRTNFFTISFWQTMLNSPQLL